MVQSLVKLAAIGMLVATLPLSALADWQVWTASATRQVLREAAPEKSLPVKLAAARNEWEGFQVLVRSAESVAGVNLVAGDLAGPVGAVLPAACARLYRQHQLEMTIGSFRNDDFKPGWYPDPLIPFVHPLTGKPLQGRLTAVPFALPAEQTHGFFVDINVPADARPGEYRGVYRLTAANGRAVEIPVTLTVWDFALPRVSTFQTALGDPVERMQRYYAQRAKAGKEDSPADWDALAAQVYQLLSEHRINASPPGQGMVPVAQPDGTFQVPADQIDALRKFVDRYHVNAIHTAHPSRAVKDPEAQRERLHAWLAAWDRAITELDRPGVDFFTYLRDEPNTEEDYHYVQKWGRAIKAAKSKLKVMVVEQTKTSDPKWGDLYGAVDTWCPLFPLHDPETAAQRRALGETVWCYTALCQCKPMTPWWQLDFPLLHYRVPMWMAVSQHMRGILYWGGMSFWQQVDDPWTDPKTLDRRAGKKNPLYNGEGTLAYPGRAVGYDGIASCLRMKALRDGIEDYEYFAVLERAGRADQARAVISKLAPTFFEWDRDPAAYDQARAKLAELILKK